MSVTLPIKSEKKIKVISTLLSVHPRNHALFIVGINTALRGSDLLALTVGQVRNIASNPVVDVTEKKTNKRRSVFFNRKCVEATQNLLAWMEKEHGADSFRLGDDAPLFQNRRGDVICRDTLTRLVAKWCDQVGLKRKPGKTTYGSHTLRKTLGYHMYRRGARVEDLMQIFNHTSPGQTLTYICIESREVQALHEMTALG